MLCSHIQYHLALNVLALTRNIAQSGSPIGLVAVRSARLAFLVYPAD